MFTVEPIFKQLADRPMAHCAFIDLMPDGSLMVAWFGGAFETAQDMVILASRRDVGCESWSTPSVIAGINNRALGQPVFLPRSDGSVWLFFVIITQPPPPPPTTQFNILPPPQAWDSAQPYWQKSSDSGRNWEKPTHLLDYQGLMFRSRPLVLPNRIILPVYDENTWESRMLLSDDDGNSWRLTAPIVTPTGNIHASLARLSDGRILAYLRTRGTKEYIWRTESIDDGETWSKPTPTQFPNPNSGICLLRLNSGRLILAFNNSHDSRTPLCIASADEDENWRSIRILDDGDGEFSYPAMIQTADQNIHIVYTYQRKHIQHACFTEEWLAIGDPV